MEEAAAKVAETGIGGKNMILFQAQVSASNLQQIKGDLEQIAAGNISQDISKIFEDVGPGIDVEFVGEEEAVA